MSQYFCCQFPHQASSRNPFVRSTMAPSSAMCCVRVAGDTALNLATGSMTRRARRAPSTSRSLRLLGRAFSSLILWCDGIHGWECLSLKLPWLLISIQKCHHSLSLSQAEACLRGKTPAQLFGKAGASEDGYRLQTLKLPRPHLDGQKIYGMNSIDIEFWQPYMTMYWYWKILKVYGDLWNL